MARSRTAELENAPVYRQRTTAAGPQWEQVEGTQTGDLPDRMFDGVDDPTKVNLLYHAYDGRVVAVNRAFSPIRLNDTFPISDMSVPERWRGKSVWYLDPKQVEVPEYPEKVCPLSPNAPQETQEALEAMGYIPGTCTKKGIVNMNAHLTAKHRKFNDDWKNYQDAQRQEKQAEAFIKLAESLAAREAN